MRSLSRTISPYLYLHSVSLFSITQFESYNPIKDLQGKEKTFGGVSSF